MRGKSSQQPTLSPELTSSSRLCDALSLTSLSSPDLSQIMIKLLFLTQKFTIFSYLITQFMPLNTILLFLRNLCTSLLNLTDFLYTMTPKNSNLWR